jgi:acetyl esterase/lipase
VEIEGKPLVDAGYTLFTVNHRATPRFQYPAAVDDVQRAVRFVRHYAKDYSIDPYRIGAMGGSSGGHLVSMLGVLDGKGDPNDESPINRESAKVQCVAARAAPSDFLHRYGQGASSWFLGVEIREDTEPESAEYRIAAEASPISHVSPDDPPFLLLHGDADTSVPISNTETFSAVLRAAGVEVKVLRIPGAGHGPGVLRIKEHGVDYIAEIVEWFDQHLCI